MTPAQERGISFGTAAAVTSVFFINFCATIFQCGCASLWSGADSHCNIHSNDGHHCPWCAHGRAASVIPYIVIIAAQAFLALSRYRMPIFVRLALTTAAFPVAGALLAMAAGLASGYWR